MSKWVRVCSTSELEKGEMIDFDHDDKKILLANLNGKIYATNRICTHADADLSTGILSEEGITCPLHLSTFNLQTGVPKTFLQRRLLKPTTLK